MIRHHICIALVTVAIGIPGAFFTIAMPAIMRDGGASLAEIGFIYIIWAPSALKWLWAPWFDRLPRPPFGTSFGWMRALVIALALTFLPVLFFVGGPSTGALVSLAVFSAALSATLQLVLAGWLIADFDERARAVANGVGVAGMVAGGVIGGGLLPVLAEGFGWQPVVVAAAALIAAASLGTTGLRRRAVPGGEASPSFGFMKAWAQLFRRPGSIPLLVVLGLMSLSAGADVTVPARLIDAGFSVPETSLLLGTVATLVIIPVSALSGAALRLWGRRPVLGLLCLGKGVVLAALAAAIPPALVATLSILDFCLAGGLTVAIWQVCMAHCEGAEAPVGGYAVLTAADAGMRLAGGLAAGALGAVLGYVGLFVAASCLSILAGLLTVRLRPAGAGAAA